MKRVLVVLSIMLLASFASASVVDFNAYSQLDVPQTVVSYQGLDFTSSGTFMYVWDGSSPNGNGTPALIFAGFGVNDFMTITKTGGGAFTLNSVDMAISWYDGNGSEVITANGNPLTLIQGLQTYPLNLTSTSFTFSGVPSASGYWVMDNVVYNATPEPSTLLTLGSGILGLAGLARKRLFS